MHCQGRSPPPSWPGVQECPGRARGEREIGAKPVRNSLKGIRGGWVEGYVSGSESAEIDTRRQNALFLSASLYFSKRGAY